MTDRIKHKSGEPDGVNAVAYEFDTYINLVTAGAKLLSIKNTGQEQFAIDKDGQILGPNLTPLAFKSFDASDANAEAFVFDTYWNLAIAGGKLFSLKNNSIEKFAIDKDGNIIMAGIIKDLLLERIAVADNYTTDGEDIIAITDVTYPRTITISSADIAKGSSTKAYQIIIKDESGGAGSNSITVATEGLQKINGLDTLDIGIDYGSAVLYSNGTNLFTY